MMALLLVSATTQAAAKQQKTQHLYMFGFAASFKDSTVYITDIQDVQGAWVDTKTKFLLDRDSYSQQLRRWLADERKESSRVCLVVFDKSKSKAEKKLVKLRKKYEGKKSRAYDIRQLTAAEFKFEAIERSSDE
jgi:hypothetical protein